MKTKLVMTVTGGDWKKLAYGEGLARNQFAVACNDDGSVFTIGTVNELGGVCDDCTMKELNPSKAVKIEIYEVTLEE